ncbi:MAG: dihydroorotate dehydrogenase [bacterium]
MTKEFAPDLSVKLGRLHLKNPVSVCSGTFGYGEEFSDFYNPSELGALVTKSVTLEERAGNPPPRIVETPSGILNSIGIQNVGVKRFLEEKVPFLQTLKTVRIVSVAGSTQEEYVEVVKMLEGTKGIDAVEINISCPNVKEGGMSFGVSAGSAAALTAAVRRATAMPLIVKLSPNVTDIVEIARAVVDAGAEILSLVNTFRAIAIDIKTRKPALGAVTGGLSGPAIKPLALFHIFQIALKMDVPVIGMGGIMTGDDALEFVFAGAHAVAVGTANFIDPFTPLRIIEHLKEYCRLNNVLKFTSLIGEAKKQIG